MQISNNRCRYLSLSIYLVNSKNIKSYYCNSSDTMRIMYSHMSHCSVQPWNTNSTQFTMWLGSRIGNWSQETHFLSSVSSRITWTNKDLLFNAQFPCGFILDSYLIPSESSLKDDQLLMTCHVSTFPTENKCTFMMRLGICYPNHSKLEEFQKIYSEPRMSLTFPHSYFLKQSVKSRKDCMAWQWRRF